MAEEAKGQFKGVLMSDPDRQASAAGGLLEQDDVVVLAGMGDAADVADSHVEEVGRWRLAWHHPSRPGRSDVPLSMLPVPRWGSGTGNTLVTCAWGGADNGIEPSRELGKHGSAACRGALMQVLGHGG